MNRKYIDFAPVRRPKTAVKKKPVKTVVVEKVEVTSIKKASPKPAPAFIEKPPVLGVVEEVGNNKPSLQKRPLGTAPSHFKEKKAEISNIKSQKVGNKAKPTGLSVKPADKPDKSTYNTPSTKFINQDKVKKRPLSKNVYRKEVKVPKEEPKGPVTIITKPEKDAHVSLVITIILTIILGAAAGTVAFLLLPK